MKTYLMSILFVLCSFTHVLSINPKVPSNSNSNPADHHGKSLLSGSHKNNLINNPGFENKTSKWSLGKYNGASGLFTTDTINPIDGNQSALLITKSKGNQYDDLQLFTFFNLQKQSNHDISFTAHIKTSCDVTISVSNGFETFYEARVTLRPDKQIYGPFSFSSIQDHLFSYFSLNLGKTNTEIRLDNVVINARPIIREFEQMESKMGSTFLLIKIKTTYTSYRRPWRKSTHQSCYMTIIIML